MGVVNFETARRRSRRAFAGLVLAAFVAVFAATIAIATQWQSIAAVLANVVSTAKDAVAGLTTFDPIKRTPEIDAEAVEGNPDPRYLIAEQSPGGTRVNQAFTICSGSKRVTCIVDGDTFWLRGEKIRIADIDTPEIGKPQCAQELALGQKAKLRLQTLLNAGPFEMHPLPDRDTDKYGRSLRVITRNGQSIGDRLVADGLARTWEGRRRPWCQ